MPARSGAIKSPSLMGNVNRGLLWLPQTNRIKYHAARMFGRLILWITLAVLREPAL